MGVDKTLIYIGLTDLLIVKISSHVGLEESAS